ncbi:hypothetical protein [Aquiflexum lacus]|uniref:hypothetical protein n=1 Tax=Aquiflexum lacus TaxID=2483805 RepID=UPI0018958E67|nr:hypothetical protein [Aquiflexum lacus]
MKKLFIPFLFFVVLSSCQQVDKDPEINILGYWNLVEVTGSISNLDYSGSEIDFSEKYIFNDDGSFIKITNKIKGSGKLLTVPEQALGLYELIPSDNSAHLFELILTFETNLDLVANCGEGNQEFLYINNSKNLTNFSWAACDGLGFIYSK